MPDHIAVIDVVVQPMPVVAVSALGVQGPPGPPGPAGPPGASSGGDVVGPASAVDNRLALFNGTTGKVLDAGPDGTISGSLSIGSNPAATGGLRMANDKGMWVRNAANNADLLAVNVSSIDQVQIGYQAGSVAVYPHTSFSQGTDVAGSVTVGTAVAVGTNPAQSGAVRLANEEGIAGRNGANTADVSVVKVRPWDEIAIGGPAASSVGMSATGAFVGLGVTGAATTAYTWGVVNTGALQPSADVAFDLGAPSARVKTAHIGVGLNLKETTAPAAPAADTAILFLKDNGSGKSQLMIQFATGAPVQIAIQP